MNKLLKFSAITLGSLLAMSANANWYNIHKVQYLMQNFEQRDAVVRMYADTNLAEMIDVGNQLDDGACLPWDMMGGVDFDALAVSTSAEYSIDHDGDVKVAFYPFDSADEKSVFFVRFDQDDQISNIFDADYESFTNQFAECIDSL